MKTRILSTILVAVIIWTACTQEETPLKTEVLDLPETPYKYGQGNDNLSTLGRVLFYDRRVSVNNSLSCASCHKQELAFSDDQAGSIGFDGRRTSRNSMPIQNIGSRLDSAFAQPGIIFDPIFAPSFTELFWDGRESELKSMVLKPIVNHVEMGVRDLDGLNDKLASIPYYNDLFQKAYGSPEVTSEKIGNALSSFLMSITSRETKFDKFLRREAQLTAEEMRGQSLFNTTYECNECHQAQNPQGYKQAGTFANVGLDPNPPDKGRALVTKNSSDNGRFKIPSLRNVTVTGPYMHDGRLATLEDVLDHYSEGIQNDPNLDFRLQRNGQAMRMHIPDADKKAIIAFLSTLTDEEMLTDVRFSNPFKAQ